MEAVSKSSTVRPSTPAPRCRGPAKVVMMDVVGGGCRKSAGSTGDVGELIGEAG